jgi:heterodisulfide reductase subunit A
MNSIKFSNFLKHKNPNIQVHQFYKDLCIPGKSQQRFYEKIAKMDVKFVRYDTLQVSGKNGSALIEYSNGGESKEALTVDMVILSEAMIPSRDTGKLAEVLGISQDKRGFFATRTDKLSPITTEKDGIYVAGCAEGPKDIPESIAQAEAAVGRILADFR